MNEIRVEIDTIDGGRLTFTRPYPSEATYEDGDYTDLIAAEQHLETLARILRTFRADKARSGRLRFCNNHAERGPHDCALEKS